MREQDALRVLVLAYDSLIWMKPVQSCLYPGRAWLDIKIVGNSEKTIVST